jgi:hypothetical protein
MWGYLEFRQMELHMIMQARSHNINDGTIKFDGQIVWLEGDTNATESKKQVRLHAVGQRLRDARATHAAITT